MLQSVIEDAKKQQKNGLVTVVGTKKNHFMSDTKWLLKHGFEKIGQIIQFPIDIISNHFITTIRTLCFNLIYLIEE